MTRRKKAWNWAVAVALVIFGGASVAAAQSSLQGGGLSTKAILALEQCFDAFQNFTCGAQAGAITGAGTDGRNTRWSGAATIADGSFLDDGTNATLEDDVEFIIGETASTGLGGSPAVGGITWNTFAGSGVERLEIDATANAGLLITVGAGNQLGGFIVADPSFINTFTQNPPATAGNSLPSWIFFVDDPTAMDDASDSRHGVIIEMESNAGDAAFSNQRALLIDDTGATAADQEAIRIGSGWDEEIFLAAVDGVFHFTNDVSFEAFRGTEVLKLNEFPRLVADYADLRMVSVGNGDTMAVMNGSDTYSWLEINFVNGGHGTGGNFVYGVNVTPSGITGSAFATEIAFNVGSGWDAFLTVDEGVDTATFTVPTLTADHTYTFPNASGTVALTTDLGGTTDRIAKFTSSTATGDSNLLNEDTPAGGDSGSSLTLFGVIEDMEGGDTVNMFLVDITNGDHTSTGNTLNGVLIDDITEDPDATEVGFSVGSGFDYMLVSDVRTVAVADNVGTNEVGLFFDESTDRGAGTGTADCALVARLSNGTELNVAILVTDGGCP